MAATPSYGYSGTMETYSTSGSITRGYNYPGALTSYSQALYERRKQEYQQMVQMQDNVARQWDFQAPAKLTFSSEGKPNGIKYLDDDYNSNEPEDILSRLRKETKEFIGEGLN